MEVEDISPTVMILSVRAESSRVQLLQILVDVGAIGVEPPSVSLIIILELAAC